MSWGLTSEQEFAWNRRHMPRTERAIARLPDLRDKRIACSVHLEGKMVPLYEGMMARGAQFFLTTCNPHTVRPDVVAYLRKLGAHVQAEPGISAPDQAASFAAALAWKPTHLIEMGADLTVLARSTSAAGIQGSVECTASGIHRLRGIDLRYPVFDVDALPIKQGIHNRFMVGTCTWQTFMQVTRLSLHEKRVLVVGYGSVGRGVAESARAQGAQTVVAEIDPARALQARFKGFEVTTLDQTLGSADVVVTATGATGVVGKAHFSRLKHHAFLLNVGHLNEEIDVPALLAHPHEAIGPHITEIRLAERSVFLLAQGVLFNLAAGFGDSINAFDTTVAGGVAGLLHLFGEGGRAAPGVHELPAGSWESFVAA